jgi:hypothetical protein
MTIEVTALDAGAGSSFDQSPVPAGVFPFPPITATTFIEMYDRDSAHSIT